MRVALYARVSTKEHGQDNANQLIALREHCAKQGWEIVEEYCDEVSGKTSDKRPAFKKMFHDASRRKFDLVLFWALDRFSREGTYPTLRALEELDTYGVGFRSFTESWIDSTGVFRDVVLAILATLAKMEREKLSTRIHAGLVRARVENRIGGRPKVNVKDAAILDLHHQGFSLRKIARQLKVCAMTVKRRIDAEERLK